MYINIYKQLGRLADFVPWQLYTTFEEAKNEADHGTCLTYRKTVSVEGIRRIRDDSDLNPHFPDTYMCNAGDIYYDPIVKNYDDT